MTYTEITWAADTPVSVENLNHLETQYDEAISNINDHNHDDDYYLKTYIESNFWNTGNVGPSSGCDADTLGGYEASEFAGIGVPSGIIILWHGAVGDIPGGWYLCNGANGTPDLRGRFVVSAGGTYGVGNTGGSSLVTPTATIDIQSHILTIPEMPYHHHSVIDKHHSPDRGYAPLTQGRLVAINFVSITRDTTYVGSGQGHDHEGSFVGDEQENRPPYYALCWIQKS